MIIRANKEEEMLQKALEQLKLTEKNQQIAEKYLDLSVPEDPKLLEEAERQDLNELDSKVHRSLYDTFLNPMKERNEELAKRFIRLIVGIGGTTAQDTVSYHGYSGDFHYAQQVLTPVQNGAIRAEYMCRVLRLLKESEFHFLVEMGQKDPDVLLQMIDLCHDENAVNTKMFLSAIYLYCVKPLEQERSRICPPAGPGDPRAEAAPEKIREQVEYLEGRLMGNLDILFKGADKPEGEDFERLKAFVRDTDPGEAIPSEICAFFSGRQRNDYIMKFLPILAFMAVDHSDRFINVIRLAAAFDGDTIPNLPLDACLDMGKAWFEAHIEALEAYLPIPTEAYIRWAILRREKKILTRIARDHEELKDRLMEDYRRVIAHEITGEYKPEQEKAERYVLGELEIGDILPYVKEWRDLHIYMYQRENKIQVCLEYGLDQLFRRSLILECLRLNDSYFRLHWLDPKLEETQKSIGYQKVYDPRQLRLLLDLMEKEDIPALYQIDFMGDISTGYECAKALAERHPDWRGNYIEAAGGSLASTRILMLRTMNVLGADYKEALLARACETAKQVREYLQEIYAEHREWEADILELLKSRKGGARELAVQVLAAWGTEKYQEALSQALEAEKTKKIREQIQKILNPDGQEAKELTQEERIAEILSGGRKRKLAWFLSEERSKVHKNDGQEASEDLLAAILIAYADMREPGISKEAKELTAQLHTGELAAYVRELYDCWFAEGAPAKKKWVLYAASIHGKEQIVPVFYAQIQEWAKNSRGALASDAVRALALNGTSTALLQVDQIARKFRFRQVKAAASQALEDAAKQLGITKEELEDRIVPDLGFDERMEQRFDYGDRTFRVILSPVLALEVYDAKGKQLKNLPAPGKQDDPERAKASYEGWKLLKKQLKTVVTNQTLRLEQALGSGRQWTVEQWSALFVQNPVMHQFAAGLVWGIYTDGKPEQTFRYMEDGSFNTVDEEEYELPENGVIGLVHPLELSAELLEAWKEQLSDYEITQPVVQLERPVYQVTEEEREQDELSRFNGQVLNGLSLSGKLLNMGWYRGEILDGGGFFDFCRKDGEVETILSFSGCSVGYENEEVTVYGLHFHKPGVCKRVGNTWETERYRLGEIEPRHFSEIVLQVMKAVGALK